MSDDITSNYHGGDPYSAAAHDSTSDEQKERTRARILRSLREDGNATCEALEDRLGLSHQTCSARVSELRKAELVREVGRAKTRTGSTARIHGPAT